MKIARKIKQANRTLIEYENGQKEIQTRTGTYEVKLDEYERLIEVFKNTILISPPKNCNIDDYDIFGKHKNWPKKIIWNYNKNSWTEFGKKNILKYDIKPFVEKFKDEYFSAENKLMVNENLQTIQKFTRLHVLVDDINTDIFIYGGKKWYSLIIKRFNKFISIDDNGL